MGNNCTGETFAQAIDASIVFGSGFTAYFNRFTTATGQMLLDVSYFGSPGNYQVWLGGVKHLNGSASGFLSTAGSGNPYGADALSCGTITINYDNGASVSFQGLIGDIQISTSYEGTEEISLSWVFSDDQSPTVVWAPS